MPENKASQAASRLPGFNCGACGFARCDAFAEALAAGAAQLSACTTLDQERFHRNKEMVEQILGRGERQREQTAAEPRPVGVLDHYEADFVLLPLAGEHACREILLPITPGKVGAGDVIRYRPLGCPITHFARIREIKDGLLVVHMVGPRHRIDEDDFRFTEIGVCMVIGFEGEVQGRMPDVGETVRFLPGECMMQKVHSGVVVNAEGRTVRIEGLDLKVWAPPVRRG